jgi:dUTPase
MHRAVLPFWSKLTPMFGKNAMSDALSAGDISISYEYDILDTPSRLKDAATVDPHDPAALGTRIFQRHFFGDRLGLTLGPIVVSDKFNRLPGRVLFKGRPGHFDLSQSDGQIEIMPGESLGVHSIEYVRIGAKVAAYILPRLTLATAGLVVMPTYIDPYWEGILQLYITNFSTRPYSLKFGERIAICRFYEVKGADENPEVKSQFAQKSHHYGLNWRRILDSDADVQPRRKRHVPVAVYRERLRAKAALFLTNWHNFFGLAAGAALITTIFVYANFQSKAGQIDALSTQIQSLKSAVDHETADQKDLDRDFPQSGTLDVEIPSSQQQLIQEITLERRPPAGAQVLILPTPLNTPVAATGKIYCGSSPADCKLRISIQRTTDLSHQLSAQFKWLILGR